MKNKGYTLIELLGVIIILALLISFVLPSVINSIKSSTDKKDNLTEELIITAAQRYLDENANKFYSIYGNTYCISVNTLVDNNYLKDSIELKEKDIINNKSVKVSYTNKTNIELVNKNSCQDFIVDLMNMTPVIYDGNNWKVADTRYEWYNYEKQEWANAVILNKDSNKKVGDKLVVDGENPDVLAMLVWIPRYEYKIDGTYGKGGTSADLPGEIEVNFISKETKIPSPGYRIHPAFNFGGTDISGIWVGKFELSHATKTTSTMDCTNENCEEGNGIRVLPNKLALDYNSISSFFYGMRSMSKEGNIFGIDKNITDTHMMKNSEWGAVAYLTQSKYGKYGNNDYEGREKEVYINNSSSEYTGRSGGSYGGNTAVNTVYTDKPDVTTQYIETGFYTYDGYLLSYNSNTKAEPETRNMKKIASTTGNIYGIYDMSGGAGEYVMGVFANSEGYKWSGNSSTANSGFVGKVGTAGEDIEGLEWPNEKYYEVYGAYSDTTITSIWACNLGICYGHALSETASWYGDYSGFVSSSNPWFVRGGNYIIAGGVFFSFGVYGNAGDGASARVVFTPIVEN